MKFIFPQNYNFKSKFLGIIDYSTLFLNIVWDLFIFGFNHENILCIIIYLIKYFKNSKLYLYKKS